MRNDTYRDAVGKVCGVQLHSGDTCEAKPGEDMPFPICNRHAIQVALAVRTVAATALLNDGVNHGKMRRDLEQGSVVYYVALPGDRIKIGTTTNLPQRLNALRADRAWVLATEPGGVTVERRRHQQFAQHRIGQREDFRDVPALREWIAEVKQKQQ
jgi:hypothetical protein